MIRQVVERAIEVNAEEDGGPAVTAIHVSGSYADGAPDVGDVDLAIEYDTLDFQTDVAMFPLGRGPLVALHPRLLTGLDGVSPFWGLDEDDAVMGRRPLIVWRRGEPVERAIDRLANIPMDDHFTRRVRRGSESAASDSA
jgi:hypothetical protein